MTPDCARACFTLAKVPRECPATRGLREGGCMQVLTTAPSSPHRLLASVSGVPTAYLGSAGPMIALLRKAYVHRSALDCMLSAC